jgi:hypothetical protein
VHREIFMDGRTLEPDPNPTWMGYSVGRWEGDTLVVESNGYADRSWLDWDGHPHTEALRITERYTRRDFGHIDVKRIDGGSDGVSQRDPFHDADEVPGRHRAHRGLCDNNAASLAPDRENAARAGRGRSGRHALRYVGVYDLVDADDNKTVPPSR